MPRIIFPAVAYLGINIDQAGLHAAFRYNGFHLPGDFIEAVAGICTYMYGFLHIPDLTLTVRLMISSFKLLVYVAKTYQFVFDIEHSPFYNARPGLFPRPGL